jgi:xanthosine utilization system XapX-like protein
MKNLKIKLHDKEKSHFWCKPKEAKPFALSKIRGKKAQMDMAGLMIGLLWALIMVSLLIGLVPAFVDLLGIGMNSEGLNCKGTVDATNPSLSYNATIGEKSSIACLGMKLYLPYLVLGVLMGIVGKLLYNRTQPQLYQ